MRLLILFGLVLPVTSRLLDTVSPSIVGGSPADLGDHPYQLSLRVTGAHSCGASLISSTRAVTAAHCGGSAISVYSVLGGTVDRTDTTCSTCTLWVLTAFIRHPNFVNSGAQGYPNDVGVLEFLPIATNANLGPILLAQSTDGNFAGQTCTISGWGRTSPTSGLPVLLLEANVTVLTNAACGAEWSAAQINDGHACIVSPTACPCNGDSGGPLECSDLLAGVMSWGASSCSPDIPSVYTRVSYFYNWITAQ